MDQSTARALGALYIALTNAMPTAAAALAHDTIRDLIDSPHSSPEERRIYRNIISAVDGESRARFEVITGGAA